MNTYLQPDRLTLPSTSPEITLTQERSVKRFFLTRPSFGATDVQLPALRLHTYYDEKTRSYLARLTRVTITTGADGFMVDNGPIDTVERHVAASVTPRFYATSFARFDAATLAAAQAPAGAGQ
ncbi:hypothetical protein D1871_04500 [Nakamurella silvestris]|nr:hypothetical protein D1871_04500 [Nakamurella silvestris]